jgi:DNA-binding transcriptional regulator YdaS (Cro superfamily)
MKNTHIPRLLEFFKNDRHQLAQAGGVSYQLACQWVRNERRVGPVPAIRLEQATGGLVKAYQLRPDLFDKPAKAK